MGLFINLLGDVLIELLPSNLPLAESRHVVYHFSDVVFSQAVLQLLRNPLQIFELQHFLLLRVDQGKHGSSAVLTKRTADLFGDELEEGLEVDPLSGEVLIEGAEGVEDEFELAVEAEGAGSVEDVGHIAVPAVVAVEIEHLEEILAVLLGEDGIFGDDVSREDCLAVLFGQLLPAVHHLNGYNVIITKGGPINAVMKDVN